MAYDEHDFEKDLKDAVDEAIDDKMWELSEKLDQRERALEKKIEVWGSIAQAFENLSNKLEQERKLREANIEAFEKYSAADQAAIISYNEFKCAVESKCGFINSEKTYRNREKINSFRLILWVICKLLFGIGMLNWLVVSCGINKYKATELAGASISGFWLPALIIAGIVVCIGWFVAYYPWLEYDSGRVPYFQNIVFAVVMFRIYYIDGCDPWIIAALIACQLIPFIIRLIRGNYKKEKKHVLSVSVLENIIKARVSKKNENGMYGRTGLTFENVKNWAESDAVAAAVDSVDWSPWTYDEKLRRSERKLMYKFETENGDFAQETLEDCKRIPNRHTLINDFHWFVDIFCDVVPIALSYLLMAQYYKWSMIGLAIWLLLTWLLNEKRDRFFS